MNIRTLVEIQNGRVRVQETDTETVVTISVPAAGSHDPEQAAEVMAENYQRARQRIDELKAELKQATSGHVCTERCEPNKHVAFVGRQRLTELEAEVEKLTTALIKTRNEREAIRTELARNDDRKWAERAETQVSKLGVELASARASAQQAAQDLGNATSQLEQIREAVAGVAVLHAARDAMNSAPLIPGEQALAKAVLTIRDTFTVTELQ